jgi:hypothetical protein
MPWDRRTAQQQQAEQARALVAQLVHAVGPFSPYWRVRFSELGTTAAANATPAALAALPPVGERDVCPDGDPRGAAALVLQAGEQGWALHADGPTLRRAMVRRLVRSGGYRAVVEADTRPTTFVEAGLAFRFPVASTRGDLDVVARTGARLWQVLGLGAADVLVGGIPLTRTAALQGLELAALASGSPALFPGEDLADLVRALHLVPATVLALPAGTAGRTLDDLDEAGAPLGHLRTLLLVGAPDPVERADAEEALVRAGAGARTLAVHVPDGHRLLWGECRPGSGLHTYPDLEVLHAVDLESGTTVDGGGELVLTQLGLHGTALVRWRTGDLVDGVDRTPCPSCGRTVPRVVGARRGALVPSMALRTGPRPVDLRGVAAALAGRPDVVDWRVVVATSARDAAEDLVVHVVAHRDEDLSDVAVGVARDVRQAAGLLPSQVVVADTLPHGTPLVGRVLTQP